MISIVLQPKTTAHVHENVVGMYTHQFI